MMVDKKEGQIIWMLRAWALLSIVSAHCTSVGTDASFTTAYTSKFMSSFGSLGVALFFFLSGYLFSYNKKSFKNFWLVKLRSLIIPWIISSSLVYFYVVIRKGGFSIIDMILSIIGYSSSFWFLLSLLLLYLIFFFLDTRGLLILTIISFLYRIPLGVGMLPHNNFFIYVNPLNWIWVFALGILCARHFPLKRLISWTESKHCFSAMMTWGGAIVLFCVLFLFTSLEKSLHYTHILYPIVALFYILSSACVMVYLAKIDLIQCFLSFVGIRSFSVYLYHEFGVAGAVSKIFQMFDDPFFVLIRPFVVIGITIALLEIITLLAKPLHLSNYIDLCIGSRKNIKVRNESTTN